MTQELDNALEGLRKSLAEDQAKTEQEIAEWTASMDQQEAELKKIAAQAAEVIQEALGLKVSNAIMLLSSTLTRLILIAEMRDVVGKGKEEQPK